MLDIFPSRAIGPFGRREKQARGGRIPVTVITGFLGAGKTTLVRNFLETPEGAGTAVVVNEYGEVGIDDALLRMSSDQVTLLGNGCMCCSSRTDLQATLRDLVADRERGRIPHFKRVIIETSGLADPGPVLQTFGTDRGLGAEYHLEQSVALADAMNGAATLDWSAEARKQVILADRLIVTKTDLADQPAVRQLQARLRELNALAPIGTAADGVTSWADLTEAPHVEWPMNDPQTGARGFVAEADHSDNVGSFLFTRTGPIQWPSFTRALDVLTTLRGPDLLRVKGFVEVAGCQGPVLVQVVQHLASPPVELQAWPDGKRGTRLVFITRNLSERAVRDLFAAVRAVAGDA